MPNFICDVRLWSGKDNTTPVKAGSMSMCLPISQAEMLHEQLMQGCSQSVKDRKLRWRSPLCLSIHVMCALVLLLSKKIFWTREQFQQNKTSLGVETQAQSSGNPVIYEAMLWVHSLWRLVDPKLSHAFELLNFFEIRNQNTFGGLHLSIPTIEYSIRKEEKKTTFCFR